MSVKRGGRRLRAAVVAWLYVWVLAVPAALLAAAPAAAAAGTNQIRQCTSEGTSSAVGTVAYAVHAGGTWTFACSGTGPFSIPITAPLTVASGSSVTLLGGGQGVTLDGGSTTQISAVSGSLTLDGLTLANGFATVGGAVYNDGGTLTVSNSTFSANIGGSSGSGGAIANTGTLIIRNSTFNDNSAALGGAILNFGGTASLNAVGGTTSVSNSTFDDNGLSGTNGLGIGGAIANATGTLTVSNSTFNDNSVVLGVGGAIENGGTLSVADSIFSNDGAVAGFGGAISNSGTATVTQSTFSGDSAGEGGAIDDSLGTLTVASSTFSGNESTAGGALATSADTVTVAGSTFSGNDASSIGGIGGAIENGGVMNVTNTTFGNNESKGQGGAIANLASLTVGSSTFSGNGAASGGGNLYGGGTLNNTIVASPQSGGNCAGGTYSGTNDLEYGDATCGGTVTASVYGKPQLLALASNGGPTDTMALGATSPAIGAGAAGICAGNPFDQRGYPRPPSGCDIGAYEYTPPSGAQLPAYTFAATPLAPSGSLTPAGTVTATVSAVTYNAQAPVPYAPVYLSLSGTGTAVAGGVPLTAAPQLFSADANGQVQVSFTAGAPFVGGGTDVLTVSGAPGAGLAPVTDTYTYPAPAVALAFTTPPLSGSAASVASMGPLEVGLQPAGGGAVAVPPGGVTVMLRSSDATGGFSATPGGPLSATLPVTIPAGATVSGAVYFGDPAAGTPTVTASASGLGAVAQQETVTAGAASAVTITAEVDTLPVGGTTPVSGLVTDRHGNPVPEPSVTLTATAGRFSAVAAVEGGYSATYQAPSTPGAVTVTASVYGGATAQTLLLVTPQGVAAQLLDVGAGGASVKDLAATGAGGAGEVEVAEYSGDPAGPPTFASSGVYFDVALLQGSSFGSLTLRRCGVSAGQSLYWWNGTAWAAVYGSPAPTYDAATGCLSVTLDGGSSPSLADLTATPFAVAAAAPAVGGGGGGGGSATPAPAVTGVAPASGTTAGGTRVTITGSGFSGVTAVDFGGTAAASFTVDSESQVTAVSPAGTGTVDVTVTTGAGRSAAGAADRFTYTVPTAAGFSDVPRSFWAYGAIQALAAKGIVAGFPDGTFQPNAAVTRAQFVKMLDLTLGLKPSTAPTPFSDVAPSAWYAASVAAAVQAGIVNGVTPTRFGPNAPLTREDLAVLLARALKLNQAAPLHFSDDAQIGAWALPGVEEAVAAGYMNGLPGGSFQPLGVATRAQAAKVLALVLQRMAP